MSEQGINLRAFDAGGAHKIAPRVNLFIVALGVAVVLHLFCLQGFLFVLPAKEIRQEKGLIFLGSILDSSQMESGPLLGRSAENERVIFSRNVPVRSEREYFESLKDVAKPRAGVFGVKRDVKSMFPAGGLKAAQKNTFQWSAGKPVEYQPLRLPDSP